MRRGVGSSPSLLAVLVTLVLAGCGDGDAADPAATPTRSPSPAATASPPPTEAGGGDTDADRPDADVEAEITVEGGQVAGGVDRIPVEVGDTVALRVSSDVADTVHVHGYDRHARVAPDEPAVVRFTADIPGVFEVELEQRGLLLAELEVTG